MPIATPLRSYSGVNKDDDTIPLHDELFGFASTFGPASSRLGQILRNACMSMISSAAGERRWFRPFDSWIKLFDRFRDITSIERVVSILKKPNCMVPLFRSIQSVPPVPIAVRGQNPYDNHESSRDGLSFTAHNSDFSCTVISSAGRKQASIAEQKDPTARVALDTVFISRVRTVGNSVVAQIVAKFGCSS